MQVQSTLFMMLLLSQTWSYESRASKTANLPPLLSSHFIQYLRSLRSLKLTTMPVRNPSPLLSLPPELRQQIYTHLLPASPTPTYHPLPTIGLTSTSHPLPPGNLLNICPLITDELLAHYYTLATWKLVLPYAFAVDPELRRLERSPSLPRIRKLEIVLLVDAALLAGRSGEEVRRRMGRTCEVLMFAEDLREVTFSYIDATSALARINRSLVATMTDSTPNAGQRDKFRFLSSLRQLGRLSEGGCAFKIGEVRPEQERDIFTQAIRHVLSDESDIELGEQHEGVGLDGANEASYLGQGIVDVQSAVIETLFAAVTEQDLSAVIGRKRKRGFEQE